MAKSNSGSSFWAELFSAGLYKRNQGRLTRQLTAVGIGAIALYGCWVLSQGPLDDPEISDGIRIGLPLGMALVSCWIIYRVVNYPRFADFLISVEAEMDKVTWASRQELYRATIVVLTTMLLLGGVLLVFDRFWMWFFKLIGFLRLI